MVVTHSSYPHSSKAETSIAVYFQNMLNWCAGQRLISGCEVTRASSSSLTVAAGTYMAITPATVVYAGATLSGITACAASNHRYDNIYLDTADGTVKVATGTPAVPTNASNFLENLAPQPPDLPSETSILLYVICVDENGIRSTDNENSIAGCADMRITTNIGAHLISYLSIGSQTRGDLATMGASSWGRLAAGASGKYLKATGAGADLVYDDLLISSLYDESQARGDIITRGATTWQRMTAGAANRYLMSNGAGTDPTYSTLAIGSLAVASEAQGDLVMRGATTWGRKATGTAGQTLISGGAGADLVWTTRTFDVAYPFGDGSAVLSTQAVTFRIPIASKITSGYIRSLDTDGGLKAGSITCTIYIHALDAVIGSAVDTITLASQSSNSKTGMNSSNGWAVTAGQWVTVIISGITTCEQIVCSLALEAT